MDAKTAKRPRKGPQRALLAKAAGLARAKLVEDNLARARSQGQAQFDSIKEMVLELNSVNAALEDTESDALIDAQDDARQRIEEDALSVQVRGGWHNPGDKDGQKPVEYEILLCTGGPACRIVGTLSEHLEPDTARMEVQDWFTPWTEIRPKVSEDNFDSEPIMLAYARVFYFGE